MIITKMALPRRTFLRGAGAMLSLPLLEAMIPAATALAKTAGHPVQRLGFIYIPHGAPMEGWTPEGEGHIVKLSPALAPLEPFRDQLTIPSNLENKNANPRVNLNDGNGSHARSNASFLSASRAKKTGGTDYELATTVDQIAAKVIGKDSPLPSLELSMDFNYVSVGNCENGYSCAYVDTLSWSSPTTPLPTEANPRVVFERLFGEGGSAASRRSSMRTDRSILDWVTEDIARLRGQIGAGDRVKVGEYLDAVREVERRIQKAEKEGEDSTAALESPVGVPESWEDHAKLMFDLQVLAFQSDVTRVVSFQLARERSARSYPQIGVPDAHHAVSHHQNDPEKRAKLTKVNNYHMTLFAYFLEKMKATPDGDGSLLDHSMYLCGSGMGDSNLHNHINLPIVVVGGGAGRLKGGRHIRYPELTPMANLHLTLLDKVGVHLDSFVDSTGRVEEMLEPLTL